MSTNQNNYNISKVASALNEDPPLQLSSYTCHGPLCHKKNMALSSIREPFVTHWFYYMAAPKNCACGTHFTVEHVLSYPKGGYLSIRHNEIRALTAEYASHSLIYSP